MIGQRIGQYVVTEKIGQGGMGSVWKARDEKLGRFAALKFVSEAGDGAHAARFAIEARSASALNHPGILTIYDVLEHEGRACLVMEFVEGKTLAELIPPGGMPAREAIRLGREIADALGAAHKSGIVHRDLKPGNIIVRPDGRAKLLDFGLAKVASAAGAPGETQTLAEPVTSQGTIVGTVNYMSPEQAEGKPVDARSDIFSLGAVLYEMASGKKAFRGDTTISTITAILRDEPAPLTGELRQLPRELERVIARCLRKEPDRRFQTTVDVRNALEEIEDELRSASGSQATAAPAAASPKRTVASWMLAGAGALAIAAIGGAWVVARKPAALTAPIVVRPLLNLPGYKADASFSPDGNAVVFVWDGGKPGNLDVYAAMLDGGQPLRLTNTPEQEMSPFYSRDGKRVFFTRQAGQNYATYSVAAFGGDEKQLTSQSGTLVGISPDGSLGLFMRFAFDSPDREVDIIDLQSGALRTVVPRAPNRMTWAQGFSPDGKWVYYRDGEFNGPFECLRVPITGGAPERAFPELSKQYELLGIVPSKRAVFLAARKKGSTGVQALLARADGSDPVELPANVPLGRPSPDGSRMAATANYRVLALYRIPAFPPRGSTPAAEFVEMGERLEASPRFSPDGRKIAVSSRREGTSGLWILDPETREMKPLFTKPSATTGSPAWSPDGKWVAFDARVSSAVGDIWVAPVDGGEARQLTNDPAEDVTPCFDPTGAWVYFSSGREGSLQLYKTPRDGGPATRVTKDGGFTCQFSPDGKYVYYLKDRAKGGIWRLDAQTGAEQPVVPEMQSRNWRVLADGIYMLDARQASVSANNGTNIGEALFYRFSTRKVEKLGFSTPKSIGLQGIDVSPDRKWVYYSQLHSEGTDLQLVENLPVR